MCPSFRGTSQEFPAGPWWSRSGPPLGETRSRGCRACAANGGATTAGRAWNRTAYLRARLHVSRRDMRVNLLALICLMIVGNRAEQLKFQWEPGFGPIPDHLTYSFDCDQANVREAHGKTSERIYRNVENSAGNQILQVMEGTLGYFANMFGAQGPRISQDTVVAENMYTFDTYPPCKNRLSSGTITVGEKIVELKPRTVYDPNLLFMREIPCCFPGSTCNDPSVGCFEKQQMCIMKFYDPDLDVEFPIPRKICRSCTQKPCSGGTCKNGQVMLSPLLLF
jgi:hypothetical protein